jgi:inositol transport system ATP-binding protein
MEQPILTIRGISKSFPGVQALQSVDLEIQKGVVHALMGENGAGKSTLMKILYGLYRPDEGEIIFKGQPYRIKSPFDALQAGVAMIPQEISPVPYLSVADNLFLGREKVRNLGISLIRKRATHAAARELLAEFDIDIDVMKKMNELSIANSQLVAIATAVSYNADLIIMDEPTSALTEKEVQHLFKIIRDIKSKKGISIIYISHKLDEIFEIADAVTVLRDGQTVSSNPIGKITKDSLIHDMVGRELKDFFHKTKGKIGSTLLSVRNLGVTGRFENISFDLKAGEVLGVAGLVGAGRSELMEALFGVIPATSGEIAIRGTKVEIRSPEDAIRNKIGFVTEDRKVSGLFLKMDVKDNIILPDITTYSSRGILQNGKIRKWCLEQVKALDIRTPSLDQTIDNLSGGNQQKVLIARWLLMQPDILILDEPTRGIDVGTKANIHELISNLAALGKGILMVSSEMPEILSMSDRILTMYRGRCTGELAREDATQQKVLRLVTGESIEERGDQQP